MHLIRILIGAIVLVLGLLIAAVVLVFGLVAWFIGRLFGKSGQKPVFQYSFSVNGRTTAQSRPTPKRESAVDAIDVETIDVDVTDAKPLISPPRDQ